MNTLYKIKSNDNQMLEASISKYRTVSRSVKGVPHSDGAGVRMTRVIASSELDMIDPFLLLDEFCSDRPDDYIGGFPDHPHRGFDTVTYMLAGKMRHKDNHGHEGVISPGGIQWMRAGSGIIHSEMPEQEDGLMWGFQLWINLPKTQKMLAPEYQEFVREGIPTEISADGVTVHVIAGSTTKGTTGPVKNIPTEPLYLDIEFNEGASLIQPIAEDANAFIYVYQGAVEIIAPELASTTLQRGMLGILVSGDGVHVRAIKPGTRVILLAAQPLNEPVARGGPFVMNTREEIQQAFQDLGSCKF
jgi:quercetin 2,3-dioxygenase